MITKIQKLSAIHNYISRSSVQLGVVYDYKDTKIVSNSQLYNNLNSHLLVVYDYKDTKIVSNSQRNVVGITTSKRCL